MTEDIASLRKQIKVIDKGELDLKTRALLAIGLALADDDGKCGCRDVCGCHDRCGSGCSVLTVDELGRPVETPISKKIENTAKS